MNNFTQTGKLQAIANGEMSGEDAIAALRTAYMEHHEASEAALQHGYLLSQAEARLLYGESGRPERSYG